MVSRRRFYIGQVRYDVRTAYWCVGRAQRSRFLLRCDESKCIWRRRTNANFSARNKPHHINSDHCVFNDGRFFKRTVPLFFFHPRYMSHKKPRFPKPVNRIQAWPTIIFLLINITAVMLIMSMIVINSWFSASPTTRTMRHYTVHFNDAIPEVTSNRITNLLSPQWTAK